MPQKLFPKARTRKGRRGKESNEVRRRSLAGNSPATGPFGERRRCRLDFALHRQKEGPEASESETGLAISLGATGEQQRASPQRLPRGVPSSKRKEASGRARTRAHPLRRRCQLGREAQSRARLSKRRQRQGAGLKERAWLPRLRRRTPFSRPSSGQRNARAGWDAAAAGGVRGKSRVSKRRFEVLPASPRSEGSPFFVDCKTGLLERRGRKLQDVKREKDRRCNKTPLPRQALTVDK